MSRQFSDKRITCCQLKGYLEGKTRFSIHGPRDHSRENAEPMHCKYASEGINKHDPDCVVVRRPIADLESCPLTTRQAGRAEDRGIKPESESLLEGTMWTKTGAMWPKTRNE